MFNEYMTDATEYNGMPARLNFRWSHIASPLARCACLENDGLMRRQSDREPGRKWAHLSEERRRRDVEAVGRASVEELYE
jgi:hypothetical protein